MCLGQSIVREPVIGLIKWLRPKGLNVCTHVEKCAEFKNQTLKKSITGSRFSRPCLVTFVVSQMNSVYFFSFFKFS